MGLDISRFFQSAFNMYLFKTLPPETAKLYLQILGQVYYLYKRHEKRLITANIRDAFPGMDPVMLKKVSKETFRGIFLHYFEKMYSAIPSYRTVDKYVEEHFTVQGSGIIRKALEGGKGCILVTGHWGAVEFMPWVLYRAGFPASIVFECATARLARYLKRRVANHDMQLICPALGSSILPGIMGSLGANRVVLTQCDEVDAWRKRKGRTIRLFGRELFLDDTIELLSRRSGAPVVAAFLKRVGRDRYTLVLEDVSVERTPQSVSQDVLRIWERHVEENPEQWYQWKKWRGMKSA